MNADSSRFSFLRGRRVLVTGGTGFVGRHLLPRLIQAGADVSCLTRPGSGAAGSLPREVHRKPGDLETGEGLQEALEGKDLVIHMAAKLFGLRPLDYLASNAAMARNLAQALGRLRAKGRLGGDFRLVLVSSMAATGPWDREPGAPDDAPSVPVSAYGWSKLLVEEILGRELGDAMVTLRPPIIYGSGDRGLLPMFRGARHRMAFCPGWHRTFPVSAVHGDDMAEAVLCACRPEGRGIYHVSNGAIHSMEEFYRTMGEAVGQILGRERRGILVFPVPLPLLSASAGISAAAARAWDQILRKTAGHGIRSFPQWNPDKCLEARQGGWICSGSRLRDELGFRPRMSLEEGMLEAAAGYRKDGWL